MTGLYNLRAYCSRSSFSLRFVAQHSASLSVGYSTKRCYDWSFCENRFLESPRLTPNGRAERFLTNCQQRFGFEDPQFPPPSEEAQPQASGCIMFTFVLTTSQHRSKLAGKRYHKAMRPGFCCGGVTRIFIRNPKSVVVVSSPLRHPSVTRSTVPIRHGSVPNSTQSVSSMLATIRPLACISEFAIHQYSFMLSLMLSCRLCQAAEDRALFFLYNHRCPPPPDQFVFRPHLTFSHT